MSTAYAYAVTSSSSGLGRTTLERREPDPGLLIRKRRTYAESLIGGIAETQEMLDFCAEQSVESDIEVVAADQLNTAYDRMVAGDVKYRFVLDAGSLKEDS